MQTELDIRHWEEIIVRDLPKGATGIIAIHNTNRGPALGGSRFFDYNHHPFRAFMAMEDVLRLSRGMSYKAAAANLKLGGGKSVIMANPANYTPEERRELFVAFGDMVESLGGRYITAEDVGTVLEDMVAVQTRTTHVTGLPAEHGGLGDPSPLTAVGVLEAINHGREFHLKKSPQETSVAIQGLGKVGHYLAKYLNEQGYQLVITDINAENLLQAQQATGARVVKPEEIYDVDCDIYAPCAMGKTVNHTTLPKIKARMICGSANNQLENAEIGKVMKEKDILYAPDYVVNLGGLTLVYHEMNKSTYEAAEADTKKNIRDGLNEIYALASEKGIPTNMAADQVMRKRIYG